MAQGGLVLGSSLNLFPHSKEQKFYNILYDVWEEVAMQIKKRNNKHETRFTNDDISLFRNSKNPPESMIRAWKTDNVTFGDLLDVLQVSKSYRAADFIKGVLNMPENVDTVNEDSLKISYKTISSWTNNFHKEKYIASGGFAEVYKGMKGSLAVAVKLFSRLDNDQMNTFTNEVETLSRCKHPNLLELLYYSDDVHPCLVYEYMENGSLYNYLCDKRKMSFFHMLARIKVAEQTACGLSYLHSQNVVHRDIKSSNILLSKTLEAKIGDFGTSRLLCCSASSHIITQTIVGTYIYMAPEYLSRREISPKIDMYSFGIVLAELIEGRPAFEEHCEDSLKDILERDEGPDLIIDPQNNEAFTALKKLAIDSMSRDKYKRPTASQAEIITKDCLSKYE